MVAAAVQYDLFGEVEAAQRLAQSAPQAASTAANCFLTETPWPDLIGWWRTPKGSSPDFAAAKPKPATGAGQAEDVAGHGRPGEMDCDSKPTTPGKAGITGHWRIRWAELRGLRDSHPDVTTRLQTLADGRGHPNAVGWRWWTDDPFTLHPDGWHPSYLEDEQQADWYDGCARVETAYGDRLEAWRIALDAVALQPSPPWIRVAEYLRRRL
jgi:hypothetical protein